jgi:uncharacterized protein YndB with AHSA1/START domain
MMAALQARGAARAVADLSEGNILASVEIAAPTERVFQALTSAEIANWWVKPGVFDTREWMGDVRIGGHWRATGFRVDGAPWTLEGEFLEIDPPRRLVHTWQTPGGPGTPSVVTYLLEVIEGGTRLTLRHTGVLQPDACMGACMGWASCLTHLAMHLGALNA